MLTTQYYIYLPYYSDSSKVLIESTTEPKVRWLEKFNWPRSSEELTRILRETLKIVIIK